MVVKHKIIGIALILSALTVMGLYGAYYVVSVLGTYGFGMYCLALTLVFTFVLIRNSSLIICFFLWCFFLALILLSLFFLDIFWPINPIRFGYHLFTSIAMSVTICGFYVTSILAGSVLISAFMALIRRQAKE